MMDVISIVFRFIDFFVIAGIAFYGIKKHAIPMVEKLLREYGIFIYGLESSCKNVQLQSQSIYENIQDQERQFQAMQIRFTIWQKKCDDRLVLQKIEQQRVDDIMQQRFIVRSDYVKNDNAIKEQLPAILNTVTTTLQHKYHTAPVQKQYIDELIHSMKVKS